MITGGHRTGGSSASPPAEGSWSPSEANDRICRPQVQLPGAVSGLHRMVGDRWSFSQEAGTAVGEPAGSGRRGGSRRTQQADRHACQSLDRVRRVIDCRAGDQRRQEEWRPVGHRNGCREEPGPDLAVAAGSYRPDVGTRQRGGHRQRGHAVEAGMRRPALVENVRVIPVCGKGCGVVVADDVQVTAGVGCGDLLQEAQEFLVPVLGVTRPSCGGMPRVGSP